MPRPAKALVLLTIAALVATGCGSGHHSSSPTTTTPAGRATTTTAAPSGSSSTTGSSPPTTTAIPTPPAPATTGPLTVEATIQVPLGLVGQGPLAAEAPDGAVFVANGSPAGVVWVVDAEQPAAVAEHAPGAVVALAAGTTDLYVATASEVVDYKRSSGAEVGTWTLPPYSTANTSDARLVHLDLEGGTLWVTITAGSGADLYRITPGSPAAPVSVVDAGSAGVVIGPDGSYYSELAGAGLTGVAPGGATTVGPKLADTPNGEGGGVEYLSGVAGGFVWTVEPAGQGLDAQLHAYDAATLASAGGFSADVSAGAVADTLAGPLSLPFSIQGCPSDGACVFRISPAGLSDPTSVEGGLVLLGPYPTVVGLNSAGTATFVERLA